MKNTSFIETIIALIFTSIAGFILGIAPSLILSLAMTYMLSTILAIDIVGHLKEKKLPDLYEGLGDLCAFIAIVLNLAGLKSKNLSLLGASLIFLIVDCILIFIQHKHDGKSTEEALKEVRDEIIK